KTLKLKIKSGRDFSNEYGNDSASFLLNETAVQKIGYDDPIGRIITWGNRKGTIVGVLQDFHFNSLHQSIDPLIVRLDENWNWGTVLIRLRGEKTRETLTGLKTLWKELNPKFPFTYSFSDEQYAQLYKSEQIVSKLSTYFAFL